MNKIPEVSKITKRGVTYGIKDADARTFLQGKQDTVGDLAAIRSGAQVGATAYQKPQTGIPATDLSSDVQSDLAAIGDIKAVIPEQASSSNKLADIDFVNSTAATATTTYRGAYNLVTDLNLSVSATYAQIATALATAVQTADNNDYCYVQRPVTDDTPTEIASVERFKHNDTAWEYEYTLNNSGYTAAQWAALNSGITSGLVAKLSALPTNSELTTLLSGKVDKEYAEKKLVFNTTSGSTTFYAAVNEYRVWQGTVSTISIVLPTSNLAAGDTCGFNFSTDSSFNNFTISTGSSLYPVKPMKDFAIEAGKTYEVIALYDGNKWLVTAVEFE